jgi:hypothetical protein
MAQWFARRADDPLMENNDPLTAKIGGGGSFSAVTFGRSANVCIPLSVPSLPLLGHLP